MEKKYILIIGNDIIVTEEDVTEDDEKNEAYYTIHYNGYLYKLTIGQGGVTKSLEIIQKEPTLEIEGDDVIVSGSASETWNVEFTGSRNKYVVLPNGKILSSRWWEITEEEQQQLVAMPDADIVKMAALNSTELKLVGISSAWFRDQPENMLTIIIFDRAGCYLFNTQDYETNQYNGDYKFESYQWYYTTSTSEFTKETTKEYNGTCPIQMSDFTEDQIYCQSFLERVIDNFN